MNSIPSPSFTRESNGKRAVDIPLMLDTAPAMDTLRSDAYFCFDDYFVSELCQTWPMRRLQRIGFLGAIDYLRKGSGRSPHRRRHNRFEHSLGVARLAEAYALHRGLSGNDRRLLVAAALLHDIGHGPLSHTLEPVFEEEFGINHHRMTQRIIRGETKFGDSIGRTLRSHSVDPEEVIALIEGLHDGPLNFLFGSHINLDTLEGITRSRAFFGRRTAFGSALTLTERLSKLDELPTSELDDFWRLKHSVYNLFITANVGLALDSVAQAYMRDNISKFNEDDFLSTEHSLRIKHPYMFEIIKMVACGTRNIEKEISKNWLSVVFPFKRRAFFIDCNESLSDTSAINRRYLQSKTKSSVRLEDIIT
ncbi:HD domain-containing protein [Azorhizobium oxalatiphilum]|uniref:HD domain-containing protein n=1 Tax=Azorhizobium oxalatiphilum TaxID=980631 RepID=UPI001666179B|nr:HD domain-containing protein [Azorhizobium oxalatiphilum]